MGNTGWRTPPDVFGPLNDEFGFTLDAAASFMNHLLPRYCAENGFHRVRDEIDWLDIPATTGDGLSMQWRPSERVWCNPPYSPAPVLAAFVKKCADHAKAGGLAVMLLNASTTDTRWFHEHIWDCKMHRPRQRVEVRFLPKRIAFLDEAGVPQKSPRYSNMVCIFYPWDVAP